MGVVMTLTWGSSNGISSYLFCNLITTCSRWGGGGGGSVFDRTVFCLGLNKDILIVSQCRLCSV